MKNFDFQDADLATCPCEGGWIDAAWLYRRDPECTCKFKDTNFEHLHDVSCDAVPCPFCPLEVPS